MTNITINKKWSGLLDSISAYKLFKHPLKNNAIKQILSPVCTLAFAIGEFYKNPIGEGFHVAIAGAGLNDATNKGDAYRLLSKLLGINSLKVDLIGNEVHKDAAYAPEFLLKPNVGEGVRVATFEMTIGQYIKTNKPDLIMLNHPGFEVYSKQWFSEGEIGACFDLGIALLGVSYGNDEAEFDMYHLKAHGYQMSEPVTNPFLLDYTKEHKNPFEMLNFGSDAVKAGMMNWGGQIWKVESKCAKDNDLIDLLDTEIKLNSFLSHQLEDPSSLPVNIDTKDEQGGDWFVVRFQPELILYSRERSLIYAAHSQLAICDDVELDSTYLKSITEKSIFQSLLISAIINRDYDDEISEFINAIYEDDDDDDDDDSGDNALSEMASMMFGGDTEISEIDSNIQGDISKGAPYLIKNYSTNALSSFRDMKNRTLLHYAVGLESIEQF